MFCPQVGMPVCPVPPQPSNCQLNISLSFSFIINIKRGYMSWYGMARGGLGLPSGTGPRSLPTPSPNMYVSGVDAALNHAVTTASVSSTPLVYLMFSLLYSPIRPQYTPLQPLLYGVYPLQKTFSLPFSWFVPHSGCVRIYVGGPLLRQSA